MKIFQYNEYSVSILELISNQSAEYVPMNIQLFMGYLTECCHIMRDLVI